MTVRRILSARAQVDGLLRGLVHAATYMAHADGVYGEAELDSLIDAVREVVRRAAGEAAVAELASSSRLLDWAREARGLLRTKGPAAVLDEVARALEGGFQRDALVVAYRICAADGAISPVEAEAFRRLASALGLTGVELEAVEAMARRVAADAHAGRDDGAAETLQALTARGWRAVSAEGLEAGWFDASVAYTAASGDVVRLDLDADAHALHVHLGAAHLVVPYGARLDDALALVDGARETLSASTLDVYLPKLSALCGGVFLERGGRLVRA
jgi:tellurite resistance protein